LVISLGKPVEDEPTTNEDIDNTNTDNTNTDNTNNGANSNEATTSSKTFTINAPDGADGDLYVRVVRDDADGLFPAVDETRNSTQFPYTVTISGRGSGTVSCYIDDELQWTQDVNFSE
jgi:serine/threonine-protein kinase